MSEIQKTEVAAPPPTNSNVKRPTDAELNDLDLIIPNVYLGNISAAKDPERLKQLNITHVLTIEDTELDFELYKSLEKYKFKRLADHQYANILEVLEECLEFIDEAVRESKNILVHCFMGMSRSAALVMAYIMAREKQSVKKTLDQVRKKRYVKPNMGFYKQLELFHVMEFKVDKQSALFRSFKLENISRQVQLGNEFTQLDSLGEVEEDDDNKTVCYKCKKCR